MDRWKKVRPWRPGQIGGCIWCSKSVILCVGAGIHEPPGPTTDRSDLVLDFLNFFGPGPVRSEIFQILLVLVRFGPRFSKFC